MPLKKGVILKTKKYIFRHRTTNFLKINFRFCFIRKNKKWIKANLKANLEELKLRLSSYRNVSLITPKIFATPCSSTDCLKEKIKIKQLAECSQKIFTIS